MRGAGSDAESQSAGPWMVALWFLAAVLEGIDLQSAGIAGPGMAREFHLNPAQIGEVFAFGTVGLVVSAALGGRLADRFGRKRVLVWAVTVFGLFSLATVFSWDYASLVVARIFTGVGLGAALPNLIALVFESTPLRRRNTYVGIMYCGMPLGSAVAAAIGWAGLTQHGWRLIFYCGGLAPIIIAPLLAILLRESPYFSPGQRALRATATPNVGVPVREVLFGEGRAPITLALWLSSFCTYFAVYMLLNWLPTLLVRRGLTGSNASGVLVLFNLGGAAGIVAGGLMMDRWRHRVAVSFIYVGLFTVLLALDNAVGTSAGAAVLLVTAFAADFFATLSLMIQYLLAPLYYAAQSRGTGLGAMVGVGRVGAIAGPYTAGLLLAMGAGAGAVLASGVPGVVLSGIALLIALRRPRSAITPDAVELS